MTITISVFASAKSFTGTFETLQVLVNVISSAHRNPFIPQNANATHSKRRNYWVAPGYICAAISVAIPGNIRC